MLVLLLIIQKDKWLFTNDFVSEVRNKNDVQLIEVDNHSETELINSVLKALEDSTEDISLNFYSEGNFSPGKLTKIVSRLMKEKSRLKNVRFEGENQFFPKFKAVLEL